MLTLAACDGGSAPDSGGLHAANSSDDAIRLTAPNVRATVTLDVTQTVSGGGPYFNAFTGQTSTTLTATAPTVRYRLHSGTTAGGTFAFDMDALDLPDGSLDEARQYRIRNGFLTVLGNTGQPVPGGVVGVHQALGTQDGDPLTVMDGLVADALPSVGSSTARGGGASQVTSVSASGGLTTVEIVTQTGETGTAPVVQHRVYARREQKYVMQEMRTAVAETADGVETTRQMRLRFADVTWPQRMAAESMSAGTMAATGSVWGQYANSTGPCTPEMQVCPPGSFPGPDTPPDTSGTVSPGGGTASCSGATTPGGANLVYVHGINADGASWGSESSNNRVRGKNRCDLRVGWDTAPWLTGGDPNGRGRGRHAAQAAELSNGLNGIQGVNRNGLIFVGHSQGGLISRRVAHQFYSTAPPSGQQPYPTVRGVVTTGTPHHGANVAQNLNVAGTLVRVADVVTSSSYACRIVPSCGQVRTAVVALRTSLPIELMTSEAMRDLRPNSTAIRDVNLQNETFPRFGIRNRLGTRHPVFEVAGDWIPGNYGIPVRQAAVAMITISAVAAVVSGVVAIVWAPAAWIGVAAAALNTVLVGASAGWAAMSYGREPSDGVVELPSQEYPRATLNRLSENPSSHTAQIDGERSAADIQITLRDALGVAPRLQ